MREAQWKYTELPMTPGDPATTFELELYDLVSRSATSSRTSRAIPRNAERIADMAARLRQLRPKWPDDSDPTIEGPEE